MNAKMKKIIKIIDKNLETKNKRNHFWSPQFYSEGGILYEGFILYFYGGHAMDIYGNEKEIKVRSFDPEYYKNGYFASGVDGKNIWNSIKNLNKKNIDIVEKIDELARKGIFNDIAQACYSWATKENNPEYERMRQTRICADNNRDNGYYILAMEEKFNGPEVDMIAIGEIDNKQTLSFIEYKCTESATAGDLSFKKHYLDMLEICREKSNIERALKLCNLKRELDGMTTITASVEDIEIQYVMLVSNMLAGKVNSNFKHTGKYVSSETVKNKLIEIKALEQYEEEPFRIILMRDFDIDVLATSSRTRYMLNEGVVRKMPNSAKEFIQDIN